MNTKLDRLQTKIPLTIKEHNLAKKQLNQYKKYPKKAKQVYLNTLAKSAVEFYLQCQNFDTDWLESEGNSNNLLNHLFFNTADLLIKSQGEIIGKLQCLPVLPDANFIDIPMEVWDNRIGFIAVKLDESLQEANLLGFISQVETEEVAFNVLQTLDDLPFYLDEIKEAKAKQFTEIPLNKLVAQVTQSLATVRNKGSDNVNQSLATVRNKDSDNVNQSLATVIKKGSDNVNQSLATVIKKASDNVNQSINDLSQWLKLNFSEAKKMGWTPELSPVYKGIKIEPFHEIESLKQALKTTEDENKLILLAEKRGQNEADKIEAINVLLQIMETTENETNRWNAALALGKVDPYHPKIGVACQKTILLGIEQLKLRIASRQKEAEQTRIIMVGVYQINLEAPLPSGLELVILDEYGNRFIPQMTQNYIQYQFECNVDEEFTIKITLGNGVYQEAYKA